MINSKIAVLTDSPSDIPPQQAESAGIDILCVDITVDGKNYVEREDFTFEEYYEILNTCESIPKTSQIVAFRFLEKFLEYDDKGIDQVLFISINSTGSATHTNSIMAKEQFSKKRPDSTMKIHIVDSHTYSMIYGWHVLEAANKLKNGAQMSDVIEWLEDRFARMEAILGTFTLKFLKKSGRVNAAAAFAGELLGLRPIISLTDGVSIVESKVRGNGNVPIALMAYVETRMTDTKEFFIGGTDEEQMKELATMCKKRWKIEPIIFFKLGAAVATNTGPDALAIAFVGERRTRE